MVKIAGLYDVSECPCIVDINSYVPISFRLHTNPIGGARNIQLGDKHGQLLELKFPASSLAVSGFTLVSAAGEAFSQAPLKGDGPSEFGLPIIELPEGKRFSGAMPRLIVPTKIGLRHIGTLAEMRLGSINSFNRVVVHGRVQFLLLDDLLVGLRVIELSEVESHILDEYILRKRELFTTPLP